MKIKDVKCEVYLLEPYESPRMMRWNKPLPTGKRSYTMLRIITDDGIEGISAWGKSISEGTINAVKREIVGRDPFDREWIWQRLWYLYGRTVGEQPGLTLLSSVDIALWDLTGKALGQPIYKLLGGYRDKIKIYASSFGLPTTQEYIDEILECKERGITAYKIHPYWRMPDKDIELCRAVRKAVGDDMILMLDPSACYSRDQALRVGKVLDELNFYWYEEPIADNDIEGMIMLREKLDVPMCATEVAPRSMYDIPEYLVRRAVDIARCDAEMSSGGITPCKKIADICNAFGMQCEIHGGGIANLQLECAVKNCEFHEMFYPERFSYQRRIPLKEYAKLDNEGYIHVPQKPGLGVEIDWEALGKPAASY